MDIALELYREAQEIKKAVIGIDEVGRGAWAGPLVVAAVRLPKHYPELKDSKQLDPQKRAKLAVILREIADFVIVEVNIEQLNSENLHILNLSAMLEAGEQLRVHAGNSETLTFCDGYAPTQHPSYIAIKGGDRLLPEIAAASIIAKVHRDSIMINYCEKYPNYKFDQHKGYGTALHQQALVKYGPCPIHRVRFKPIKKLL